MKANIVSVSAEGNYEMNKPVRFILLFVLLLLLTAAQGTDSNGAGQVASDAPTLSGDPNILMGEVEWLRGEVERKEGEIHKLRQQIIELQRKGERLETLCRNAGIEIAPVASRPSRSEKAVDIGDCFKSPLTVGQTAYVAGDNRLMVRRIIGPRDMCAKLYLNQKRTVVDSEGRMEKREEDAELVLVTGISTAGLQNGQVANLRQPLRVVGIRDVMLPVVRIPPGDRKIAPAIFGAHYVLRPVRAGEVRRALKQALRPERYDHHVSEQPVDAQQGEQ